ncbi:hypothetical protein HAX54_029156, partial [Datura stramonium]|nr:hypothetical protein [Datura stramonium]
MRSFVGWSQDSEWVPCVETIKLVEKIWRREGKKDTMLLVMMMQMEFLMNYMKGFHARYTQAKHEYDYVYYGNRGWNNAQSVDTGSQERNESVPHHMEITLEVGLEKDIVENDIFKWEIEEEVVGELIEDVFLKGEKLEE